MTGSLESSATPSITINADTRYTLLRFADMIVRADVTTKKLKSRIIELDVENRELRKQLADMERKMKQ